jgi:hypothetical protein
MDRGDDPRAGLHDEEHPRPSATAIAAATGAVWGLLGYSILWEGAPFSVQRPFVQSVGGTIVLLPVRAVLWSIHLMESVAGRSFDLSRNHWWIGGLAGAVGAVAVLAGVWAVRGMARRARPPT